MVFGGVRSTFCASPRSRYLRRNNPLKLVPPIGNVDPARSSPAGSDGIRGRAPHIADPTATGNQGRTVDRPLTGSQRADNRDEYLKVRRSGSRSPSTLDVAGVRSQKPLSIFYGYPPELVARWCGVSVKTASQWASGLRKPSRQALRLFALHRDGRVLGDEWKRWKVNKGLIVDPDGNETTQSQLHGYFLILQWVAEVASRDPETQRQYFELLKRA